MSTLFYRRNTKIHFLQSRHKEPKEPLKLVHSDIVYVKVPPNRGNKYFITFINDFNRNAWVYFLKHKSDVCGIIKNFVAYIKK